MKLKQQTTEKNLLCNHSCLTST